MINSLLTIFPLQNGPHHEMGSSSSNDQFVLLLLLSIITILVLITITLIFWHKLVNNKTYLKSENNYNLNEKSVEKRPNDIEKQVRKPSIQQEILSLEENAIIDILIQNEGNILQKKLPMLTNFSKATITRILHRLEDRDLVYRSPAGRGYRVFLKENENLN